MSLFVKIIDIIDSKGIDRTDKIENEIALQKIASSYDFTPKIIDVIKTSNSYYINMQSINEMCLADKYGDKPNDLEKKYWIQIKSIISILFYREGIEYIDITPYNFIESNEKIYLIDFGHAFITNKENLKNSTPSNWFLKDFLDKIKEIYEYNPDFY